MQIILIHIKGRSFVEYGLLFPRICSEHGGQEQALKLSLNPIDIELSAIVSPSHG